MPSLLAPVVRSASIMRGVDERYLPDTFEIASRMRSARFGERSKSSPRIECSALVASARASNSDSVGPSVLRVTDATRLPKR